ncbi:MAG: histidine kinase [Acutalibacteraceae bacterium]|nr:histidine kinase [Acutalibacteraceae bacterium]
MDIAIKDGDFEINEQGKPYLINAMDETIQRCKILLTIKQGSFSYNRSLGNNLHLLDKNSENLQGNAILLVKEALLPIKQVTVCSVTPILEKGKIILKIKLKAYNQYADMEVIVQ